MFSLLREKNIVGNVIFFLFFIFDKIVECYNISQLEKNSGNVTEWEKNENILFTSFGSLHSFSS